MDSQTIVAPMTPAGSARTNDERVWGNLEKSCLGVLDLICMNYCVFLLILNFWCFLRQNDRKISFSDVKFCIN